MYIDFAINSTDINETEAKDLIGSALRYSVNSITIPYYLIRCAKQTIDINNKKTKLSCLIDYPLGISDLKTRHFAIEQAIKLKVDSIDIVIPQTLATNRKYSKIREDVKSILLLCNNNSIEIKYILEYRFFDHHCLKKICEIFDEAGIKYVYPSSGYFLDNLADNILASIFLHQNSKSLNVICTGNMWLNKHFETMIKSGLFGFRTHHISSLENFHNFRSLSQNN